MSSQFLQLRNDRLKKETGIPRYLGMELKKRHMLLKEFSVTSDQRNPVQANIPTATKSTPSCHSFLHCSACLPLASSPERTGCSICQQASQQSQTSSGTRVEKFSPVISSKKFPGNDCDDESHVLFNLIIIAVGMGNAGIDPLWVICSQLSEWRLLSPEGGRRGARWTKPQIPQGFRKCHNKETAGEEGMSTGQ